MKQSTIAIVGAGVVGSTTAYTLMMHNLASHIILVDVKDIKCKGEVYDLSDALSFSSTATIEQGTLKQAGQADIVIIAAGIAQQPGQSRSELIETNYKVVTSVIEGMKPLKNDLIIIVVTNPIDILTYVVQKRAGLPKNQIFGSGTMLDSQRLRHAIGSHIKVAEESIHVHVLGEHGDTQLVAWSSAHIAGVPLVDYPGITMDLLTRWAQQTQQKAYDIIVCKGSTAFGVAACVAAYCTNILFDTHRITTVSNYIPEFDLCLSTPVSLGSSGVINSIIPPLTSQEKKLLQKSADSINRSLLALGLK